MDGVTSALASERISMSVGFLTGGIFDTGTL